MAEGIVYMVCPRCRTVSVPPGVAGVVARRLTRRYVVEVDGKPAGEEARFTGEVRRLVAKLSGRHKNNLVDYVVETERDFTTEWTDDQGNKHKALMRERVYVVRIHPLEAVVERSGGVERLKCPVCGAVLLERRL